jgi:hypothetical protein
MKSLVDKTLKMEQNWLNVLIHFCSSTRNSVIQVYKTVCNLSLFSVRYCLVLLKYPFYVTSGASFFITQKAYTFYSSKIIY